MIARPGEAVAPSLGASGDAGRGAPEPGDSEVADLVQRAAQGDADAFGTLYDLYLDRIYRYVYYRMGRAAEAEDLTEEIFLKVWEALPSYRWRGLPFGAWLFRLARNHVIDHVRTRRETVPLVEIIPTGDPEPEEIALSTLRAQELRQLIAQLTDDQREVIVLKFLEGLSTKEIAASLGRQEGAVRAVQMRALQSLRKFMEGNTER